MCVFSFFFISLHLVHFFPHSFHYDFSHFFSLFLSFYIAFSNSIKMHVLEMLRRKFTVLKRKIIEKELKKMRTRIKKREFEVLKKLKECQNISQHP